MGQLASIGLAVIVPLAALMLASEPVLSPFGWARLVVVHVLATVPLSLLTAYLVPSRESRWREGIYLTLGLALSWLTVTQGPTLSAHLDQNHPSFLGRLLLRVLWCFSLELPWCLLAVGLNKDIGMSLQGWHALRCSEGRATLANKSRPSEYLRACHPRVYLPLALTVAVIFPAAFTVSLIGAQTTKAEELLSSGRLVRLQGLLRRLSEIGSARTVAGLKPAVLRDKLHRDLQARAAAVSQPLAASAAPVDRRELARSLALLERLAEAEELLAPLAKTDAAAMLLFAAVLQQQQRWQESSRCYRAALTQLATLPAADAGAQRQAYDGLAFNAREQHAPAEAVAAYEEALALLPEERAHFHFQLGRHYQLAGRPRLALDHLQNAALLQPAPFAERARPLIVQLRLHTPGCVVR